MSKQPISAAEGSDGSRDAVHIGDSVLFFENELRGFIYAENPINTILTFSVFPQGATREVPLLPNIKGAVFEISPPNKYKNSKRLRKRLKKYEKSKLNPDDDDPEIVDLRRLAKSEHRDNVMEQARQRGRPLFYGQTIQLKHQLTDRYVYISSTDAAHLDVTNMKATLAEDTSKHTFFRVMPRFKVRSEGDIVRFDDQIVLESVKTSGQFIHISSKQFPDEHIHQSAFEVDLSVQKSSFVLQLHSQVQSASQIASSFVKYGDVLCFLHKEMDAFVTAEGSFINVGIGEDVHLRRRKAKTGDSAIRTNVSICYWQIEQDGKATLGSAVTWATFIRLRHLCTRQYLIMNNGQLGLTKDANDKNAVFLLHPVTKESLETPYNAYCRIQHATSKMWLHAVDKPYARKQYEHKIVTSSMDLLEWDGAELRQLSGIKEMRYDDAYAIIPVDSELVLNFNFVAGCARSIARNVDRFKTNKPVESLDYIALGETLSKLMEFLQEESSRKAKAKQKILRHLRIVDALILLLKAPFKTPQGFEAVADFNNEYGIPMDEVSKSPRLVSICRLTYDLLAKFLHGSQKNELYLARHIPFFQSQVGHDLHTASMLLELVKDNRKVLDRIEPGQIKAFIQWLKQRNDPSFLNFLDVLCVCSGKAITNTQNYVLEQLIEMQKTHQLLFYTRLKQSETRETLLEEEKGQNDSQSNLVSKTRQSMKSSQSIEISRDQKSWKDIRDFSEQDKEHFSFYLAQLKVFASLCTGRNQNNIEIITTEFTPKEQVLTGLTNTTLNLNPALRVGYAQILLNAFIDVRPNTVVLGGLKLSYGWDSIHQHPGSESGKSPGLSMTGARLEDFSLIHEFMVSHLTENEHMIASHIDENRLIASVLQIAVRLCLFGYYTNIDLIKELLTPLFNLLDINTDRKTSQQKPKDQLEWINSGECYQESAQNNAMSDAKYQGALIMDALFNYRLSLRINAFLVDYKLLDGYADMMKNKHGELLPDLPLRGGNQSLPHEILSLLPAYIDNRKKPVSTEVVLKYLEVVRSRDDWLDVYDSSKNGRLVDIFLRLARYKYPNLTFMAMNIVNRHFTQVWNLFEKSQWCRILLTPESVECSNIVTQNLMLIRGFVGKKLGKEEQGDLKNALKKLADLCSLPKDALETHSINVMIMYQSKTLQTIFSILATPVDKNVKEDYDGTVEVITEGLNFLQKFCRNNALIQEKMFERLGFLLSLGEVAIRPLANCLTQMFRGNQELCLKLQEKHVEKMAIYMAKFKAFEISQFFNVIVKIEALQLPIRRNQNMVIKQLMQRRADTILMVSPSDDPIRIRMLEEGSDKTRAMNKLDKTSDEYKKWWVSDENRKLLYHVRLVRMLATCCEGENRFIESMCQNIFSAEQLLTVLINPKITMNFRRPYLRFFLWAYLNSDSANVETEIGEVQLRPEIWDFMTMLIDQVRIVFAQDLGRMFETDEGEQDVIFLFEGAVPFLRVFYDRYYQLTNQLKTSFPKHLEVVKYTIDSMLDFIDRMYLFPDFGTKRRIKEATTVLLVIQTKELLSDEQDTRLQEILQKELNRVKEAPPEKREPEYDDEGKVHVQESEIGLDKIFMTKTARREYFTYYEAELKLNDRVHNFTRNLETAYRRDPNTPRYSRKDPSGAGMPLGEEYQRQIRAFVEYDDKKRHKNGKPRFVRLKKECEILVHALQSSRENIDFLEENYRVVQIELDLKHLRLLRAPISFEFLQTPAEVKHHEHEAKNVEERVIAVQNDLNQIGVSNIILVMCTSPEEFTVRAALRLLSMMLEGGNHTVQNSLLYNFKATRNESFFHDLKDRIVRSSVAVKEARTLMAQLQRDKQKRQKLLSSTLKKNTTQKHDQETINHGTVGHGTVGHSEGHHSTNTVKGLKGDVELSPIQPGQAVVPASKELSADQQAQMLDDEKDEDIVKFKSLVGFTELIFRILQLFCERHNQEIKSYMREQKGNIKSVNLVNESVEYMEVIYLAIDDQSWSLANQVLNTIVEFAMGEQENQGTIFDAKGIDIVNHILRCPTFPRCSDKEILDLKRTAAILVRTMVEEGNETATRLAKEARAVLDISAIRQTMKTYHPDLPQTEDYDPQELGFVCYNILCRLRDHLLPYHPDIARELHLVPYQTTNKFVSTFDPTYDSDIEDDNDDEDEEDKVKRIQKKHSEAAELLKKYEQGMESIEIVKLGNLQKVYFPVGKQRQSLSENRRDALLWNVNRESPAEKIRDFIEMGEVLREEMRYQEVIQQNPVFRTILSMDHLLYNSIMILTLVINIIIIATWQADGVNKILPIVPKWYSPVIYSLGALHLLLCLFIVFRFFLENPIRRIGDVFRVTNAYYLIFIAMSAGGLATEGYLFCFHLLHIVMKNDILKRALQSVTKNGDSLLMVALLGVILIYIFSVVVFAFYRNSFDPLNGFFCDSMWQCFVTCLDWGLRSGGGLGDVLTVTNFTWQYVGLRTVFDLIFFIVITTIGLNIIFGLIIDTFSELRDEKFRTAEDMRTSCFICSLKAYDFDKSGVGFETHIKKEHNMWAYLFFLNYLEEKDPDEYAAHEAYVAALDEAKETSWFPINRAFALQEDRDEMKERLMKIERQLQNLVDRFKGEDERRMLENQQQQQDQILNTQQQAAN